LNKKISTEYYNSTDGIFLSTKILHSFGRRNGLITQLLLNIWEESVKTNKLLNGFAFLTNEELYNKTAYNLKSNAFRNFMQQHSINKKWKFLTIDTFGVKDGLFFKINLDELFLKIIPRFEKEYELNIKNSAKYGNGAKSKVMEA
jgi:hypothetical protein